MHIPSVRMVEFQQLAQFPFDKLAHTVVSKLKLSLHEFILFIYYVIGRFESSLLTFQKNNLVDINN